MPSRKPNVRRFANRQDVLAARALAASGGRCRRCEEVGPGRLAVRDGDGWLIECLARAKCDVRIGEQLREAS